MIKTSDGSFQITAPLKVAQDEKILYKYVVDDNWCIDEQAKTTSDDHGILNNYVDESDLIQLTTKNAVPIAGGLTTTTTPSTTPNASNNTLETTVIKETQPDIGADPLAAAISANPGIVIPADLEAVPKPESTTQVSDTPKDSASTINEQKSADSSMTEDDTHTLVAAETTKENILPDTEIEHVS